MGAFKKFHTEPIEHSNFTDWNNIFKGNLRGKNGRKIDN